MNSIRFFLSVTALCFTLPHAAFSQMGVNFQRVATTPYDAQMSRISRVMQAGTSAAQTLQLDQVNQWMRGLKRIPYQYTSTWKTPEELQATRSGDCKAKALSLYYLMKSKGATNVMFVIGRRTGSSQGTHAWLLWETQGKVWLLDPTDESSAVESSGFGTDEYVPHYAYNGASKLRPSSL